MENKRQNQDFPERYVLRNKWYPSREHRGGVGGGDYDFMADEQLYPASRFGKATIDPPRVRAGEENRSLVITYTPGKNGLEPGGEVAFICKGTAPLGGAFQVRDPDKPCFARFTVPMHCSIVPFDPGDWKATFPIGFRIVSGELRDNDTVRLEIEPESGFVWTRIAGRKEIKVCVKPKPAAPEYRLPEPLVVVVEPGPAERLEVHLPGTREPGQRIEAAITIRDCFDNRVPMDGVCEIAGMKPANLYGGYGVLEVEDPAEVLHLSVTHHPTELTAVSNPCVAMEDMQLFFGDLHVHDLLSEAEGYSEDVYRWAREDRRFDFIAVSPQSHGWHDNETWTVTKYMNERHYEPGQFVTFLSYEWQHSGYGDKVIHYLSGDQPCLYADDPRYDTPGKLYKALRETDAFVISHHMAYPLNSWVPGTDYTSLETDMERLIELWSMHGISEGYTRGKNPLKSFDPDNTAMEALRQGLRLGFVAGSDTHKGRPGGSPEGQNPPHWGGAAAVWAQELTRSSLFNAFQDRRTYALTGAKIVLKMFVNDEWMGSELQFSNDVSIKIDCWSPGRIQKVELIKDTKLLHEFTDMKQECHLEYEDHIAAPAYYHCRVVLEDGNLAVCSPVWVG